MDNPQPCSIDQPSTRLTTAIVFVFILSIVSLTWKSSSFAAMAPYQLANIDWNAAVNSYSTLQVRSIQSLRQLRAYTESVTTLHASAAVGQYVSAVDLQTINAVSESFFPKIRWSGTPVLLPVKLTQLIDEMLRSGKFAKQREAWLYVDPLRPIAFYPGPYGYRAYFRLGKTSTVLVMGSRIFYLLPHVNAAPVLRNCSEIINEAQLSADRPIEVANQLFYDYLSSYLSAIGIRASGYFNSQEAAVPCLFAGSLVEVHILCDSIGDPDCSVKDTARTILANLAFVGGSPRPNREPGINDPAGRLNQLLDSLDRSARKTLAVRRFEYGHPGDLLLGSGGNGEHGSLDFGVYGAILFPVPLTASAQTVIFRADQKCMEGSDIDKGTTCIHNGLEIRKAPIGEWRDNFCEDREVGWLLTCPAGHGHAGQDLWGNWMAKPGVYPLRAVADAIAFRRFPAQAAVTLSDVMGTNIDYVYRHMRPSELTKHGIGPARPVEVKRGCVIAFADRFGRISEEVTNLSENAVFYEETAPHLHFEIRVPTQYGFQNVSPYSTLVKSHLFLSTSAELFHLTNQPCGPKARDGISHLDRS
jgi:hypothetical protein